MSTDSSCFVGPWNHFAVEALCSAVMGNPYAPMGDCEHMEARTVGVGWEKSVSAEPVQTGMGANLLLPGHALTRTVKAMWPQASWLAYSAMALGGVNLPLGPRPHAPPCVASRLKFQSF